MVRGSIMNYQNLEFPAYGHVVKFGAGKIHSIARVNGTVYDLACGNTHNTKFAHRKIRLTNDPVTCKHCLKQLAKKKEPVMSKAPSLMVTVQCLQDPEIVVQGTFMGLLSPGNEVMLLGGHEDDMKVNTYLLMDEFVVTEIHDLNTGVFTHPECTTEDQEGCVDILKYASKFMASDKG
jgi:hypothetical protein